MQGAYDILTTYLQNVKKSYKLHISSFERHAYNVCMDDDEAVGAKAISKPCRLKRGSAEGARPSRKSA